ncbi:MAG TPA: 6-pyruvoyl-tetrahydropterin synthase-related protein [Actinomycetota bacterium]|nr:6-pyruvoyl-tetrahydropterin synthase-related protein [Actinomycetota bacterium]
MLATIAVFAREGLTAARTRTVWVQRVLTVLTFGAIYLVLLKTLHWNLILTRTTAAGGDMGSHHYVAEFLREELLPRGRVTGWAPGWFAGIPMLTFYFPIPYVLIALLTLPLGDQLAFKLVTVLGILLLPVTCWAAFRVLRLREPAPLLAACGACVFLFMSQATPTEQFTIWGGNIASTMAGEFPFSISFALLPLALAVLWRVCEDGKGWRAAALLVSAVVLCHILTTIVLVLGVVVLVLRRPLAVALTSFRRLALVMGVAFCLTAFWGLPFLLRVQYTAHFRWTQKPEYSLLFPNEIRPYLLLALVGLVVAVARGERRVLLYAWPAAAAAFVFVVLVRVAPEAALWNARMLPFLYLFSLLVAAYGASVVAVWLAELLQRRTGVALRYAWLAVVAVMVVAPVVGAWRHRGFVDDWAKYNYTGFEAKDGWPEARALFNTLAALPPGRVMWEFNRDYERLGTTRTLENIPVFGGQPTMEGLLIESSMNAPFHFINQKETSKTATEAVPGVPYDRFDFDFPTGLAHLRLYGVRYYVAYDACQNDQEQWVPCGDLGLQDEETQAAAAAGLPVVQRSGRFTIYEVGSGNLVEVPRYKPVLVDHPDWRGTGLTWYANPDWMQTPLVFASSDDQAARAAFAEAGRLPLTNLPREELARPGELAATTSESGDVISFRTDRVGEPHIVKVSWFPNWKVEGAEGPWLLSPALMVVVPTQPEVRLSYRDTPVDLAGKALTVVGVGALLTPTVLGWVRARRRNAP